jgi:putative nucleotidyltransferase with HDIG domain
MFHQTKVLLDQAFSQRISGHWHSAIELYEKAFVRSVETRNAQDLIESVLAIGHCYREMGEVDLAIDQLELAYELSRLQENEGSAARALNGVAIVYALNGSNEKAEEVYHRARESALQANDPLTIGSIYQNLGTLANVRGDLTEALAHYQSSLRYYERTQQERSIALVLNNLGMLQIDLHQLEDASETLDRALEICRRVGDVVTESVVHTNRTELFIALGHLEQARTSCDEAFEISSRTKDNRIKSEALKFYGAIYRETGKPHLAEIHLRQAIGIANKYANPLTEAESWRELALVLRAQQRNRESLEALNRAHGLFTALQAKQDQADVSKRLSQLEHDFLSLVQMWGESIEAKDLYTRGHCQRVADYACQIAQEAGLSAHELVWFRMGAFLHDVGKTEVPESILNKPGKLTEEERETMEQHTIIGDAMLSSIEFPWEVRPMVRSHHERWDGRGYPDGLRGKDIPFTARILRIADVFDALTTTRSYRDPLTPSEALRIMETDDGSFDPELFTLFKKLFPRFCEQVDISEV